MFNEIIDSKYIVQDQGTSDGTQVKYKIGNYWYKLDRYGGEGIAERIAYLIEKHSSLNENEYVCYEQGFVNRKPACRSINFLADEDESFITLYRLFYNVKGNNIAEVTNSFPLDERIPYVIDFVKKYTGLDITEYLAKTFTIDYIILNEDRHFNNLGVIMTPDGFRTAPIFDNGKSLLVGNQSVTRFDTIEEKIKKVIARPFSGSHKWQYEYFSSTPRITFDTNAIMAELKEMDTSDVVDIAIARVSSILTL